MVAHLAVPFTAGKLSPGRNNSLGCHVSITQEAGEPAFQESPQDPYKNAKQQPELPQPLGYVHVHTTHTHWSLLWVEIHPCLC